MVPLPGAVVAGRYILVRPIAKGGMGSVWLARHRDLGTEVAAKFMDPALIASPEARARFEREAQASAMLESQHVVHVHDYGVEDETPYLVMELLRGQDLGQRLATRGTLSLVEAAPVCRQISKALRCAHEQGIVHRDLKPANIFFAMKDDEELVKVLDFGIAKILGPENARDATRTGAIMGSVHYMSPEQVRDSKSTDARSDLWSLGVVLYQVLVGKVPFPGVEIGDVLVRICTDPVAPPSSIVPTLGLSVDLFFQKALQRNRDHRFASAREMAEAFEALSSPGPAASLDRAPQAAPFSLPASPPASLPVPTSALVSTVVLAPQGFPVVSSASSPQIPLAHAPLAEGPSPTTAVQASTQAGITQTLSPTKTPGSRLWVWGVVAGGLLTTLGGSAFLMQRFSAEATEPSSTPNELPSADPSTFPTPDVSPVVLPAPSASSSAAPSSPRPISDSEQRTAPSSLPTSSGTAAKEVAKPSSGATAKPSKPAATPPSERPVDLP